MCTTCTLPWIFCVYHLNQFIMGCDRVVPLEWIFVIVRGARDIELGDNHPTMAWHVTDEYWRIDLNDVWRRHRQSSVFSLTYECEGGSRSLDLVKFFGSAGPRHWQVVTRHKYFCEFAPVRQCSGSQLLVWWYYRIKSLGSPAIS